MINLFKKSISPKVYFIDFERSNDGQSFLSLRDGYSLEEVKDEIEKEEGCPIRITNHLDANLEEILEKYTNEKQALKALRK